MRNFTLTFLCIACLSLAAVRTSAQCPTPSGMNATSLNIGGNCFLFVQFAIPNSTVSIYNASGYVAQADVNSSGNVLVAYNCSANPIVSVLSLTASGSFCNTANISAPITLPVKFTSFSSQVISQGVLLKWATSYEFNNEKYTVEKSDDGRAWESIADVAAAKNTSVAEMKYEYTDETFKTGEIAYYRLRQQDIDGTIAYSKVVYVNDSKNTSTKVKIFPNPFVNEIQLSGVRSADINTANIRVFSITGKQVNYQLSGSNGLQLDPTLPSGMYIVNIKGEAHKILKN